MTSTSERRKRVWRLVVSEGNVGMTLESAAVNVARSATLRAVRGAAWGLAWGAARDARNETLKSLLMERMVMQSDQGGGLTTCGCEVLP